MGELWHWGGRVRWRHLAVEIETTHPVPDADSARFFHTHLECFSSLYTVKKINSNKNWMFYWSSDVILPELLRCSESFTGFAGILRTEWTFSEMLQVLRWRAILSSGSKILRDALGSLGWDSINKFIVTIDSCDSFGWQRQWMQVQADDLWTLERSKFSANLHLFLSSKFDYYQQQPGTHKKNVSQEGSPNPSATQKNPQESRSSPEDSSKKKNPWNISDVNCSVKNLKVWLEECH